MSTAHLLMIEPARDADRRTEVVRADDLGEQLLLDQERHAISVFGRP